MPQRNIPSSKKIPPRKQEVTEEMQALWDQEVAEELADELELDAEIAAGEIDPDN